MKQLPNACVLKNTFSAALYFYLVGSSQVVVTTPTLTLTLTPPLTPLVLLLL